MDTPKIDVYDYAEGHKAVTPILRPKKCYRVGDYDWFVASTPEEALSLMVYMAGDDYTLDDVTEVVGVDLDLPWHSEDDPTDRVGSLREWMEVADKPKWIAGIEP